MVRKGENMQETAEKTERVREGMRTGEFEVVKRTDIKKGNEYLYECRCRNPACGHVIYLTQSEIVKNNRKCIMCSGSLRNKDYVGEKTGSFIVIRKTDKKKKGYYLYECQCSNPDCGNIELFKSDEIKLNCRRCQICYKTKQDIEREKKMNTMPETLSQYIYMNCFGYNKEEVIEDAHISEKLKKILTKLQYDVFIARHSEGTCAKALAEKMNISRQSISTIDHTAREAIIAKRGDFE